jgi:hypothetical protein
MQEFIPLPTLKYSSIWIQECAMYISDKEFLDLLVRLKPSLSRGGRIFVKENLANASYPTRVVFNTYEELTDRSLLRSEQCFHWVFKAAGLAIELEKELNPSATHCPMYTAVLRIAD